MDPQEFAIFRNAHLVLRIFVISFLLWQAPAHIPIFLDSPVSTAIPATGLWIYLLFTGTLVFFSHFTAVESLLVSFDLIAGTFLVLLYKGALVFTAPFFLATFSAGLISWEVALGAVVFEAFLFGAVNIFSPGIVDKGITRPYFIFFFLANIAVSMSGLLKSALSRTLEKMNSLVALMEFGQELGATLSYENLSGLIFRMIQNMFHSSACALYLREPDGLLKVEAVDGLSPELFRDFHPEVAKTVLSEVFFKKSPQAFFDIHAIPEVGEQVIPRAKHIRAAMAVPLVSEDETLGILLAAAAAPKSYDKDSLKLFVALTNQAAVAVRNVQLHEKTTHLAVTDSVSGLYTHGHMQKILEQEFLKAKYETRPLSVIILDVDHFKIINDEYGHPQGDALLRQLSGVIASVVRTSDSVCRYGGDEFLIILTDADRVSATLVAEQIRQIVQDYEFVLGSHVVHVTLSAGAASFPEDAETKKELIEKADAQLYKAKNQGRNKVCSARPVAGTA